jgi:hypothetical protein
LYVFAFDAALVVVAILGLRHICKTILRWTRRAVSLRYRRYGDLSCSFAAAVNEKEKCREADE